MVKKKQAFRELEEDFADTVAENDSLKNELAWAINRTIQLGDENDRLHERLRSYEEVIVGLNLTILSSTFAKSSKSVNLCDSAGS